MGLFRYILGGEARRNLKRLDRMADKVLELEPVYLKMTDAELIGQTEIFRQRLKNGETLDGILIEAFAVCREAAAVQGHCCSGSPPSISRSPWPMHGYGHIRGQTA